MTGGIVLICRQIGYVLQGKSATGHIVRIPFGSLHWVTLAGILLGSPIALAQGRPAMVTTETVEIREVAETTTVFGEVVADTESTIAARVAGVLTDVMVRPGDTVRTGDILATFDTELLEIEFSAAKAEEAVAAAGVDLAEARMDVARRVFERANALRSSSTISEGQLEDRQGAFAEARAARDQAVARRLAAQTTLRRAQYNLDNALVQAPFDGTVLTVAAEIGGFTQSGGPIAVVLDTNALEVESNVPSRFSDALVPGLELEGRTDGGRLMMMTLRAALPTEFAATRTRPVRFVPQDTEGFSVGQSITLDLPVSAPEDAVTVPKDALIQSAGGWTVFVNADGKAQPRTVDIGRALGDRFEVLGGLVPGDEVVVRGNERLRPMQDIQAIPADGAPAQASN